MTIVCIVHYCWLLAGCLLFASFTYCRFLNRKQCVSYKQLITRDIYWKYAHTPCHRCMLNRLPCRLWWRWRRWRRRRQYNQCCFRLYICDKCDILLNVIKCINLMTIQADFPTLTGNGIPFALALAQSHNTAHNVVTRCLIIQYTSNRDWKYYMEFNENDSIWDSKILFRYNGRNVCPSSTYVRPESRHIKLNEGRSIFNVVNVRLEDGAINYRHSNTPLQLTERGLKSDFGKFIGCWWLQLKSNHRLLFPSFSFHSCSYSLRIGFSFIHRLLILLNHLKPCTRYERSVNCVIKAMRQIDTIK